MNIEPLSDAGFSCFTSQQREQIIEAATDQFWPTPILAVIADELHVLNEQVNELSQLLFDKLEGT